MSVTAHVTGLSTGPNTQPFSSALVSQRDLMLNVDGGGTAHCVCWGRSWNPSWDLRRLSEGSEGPATLGFLPGN